MSIPRNHDYKQIMTNHHQKFLPGPLNSLSPALLYMPPPPTKITDLFSVTYKFAVLKII